MQIETHAAPRVRTIVEFSAGVGGHIAAPGGLFPGGVSEANP
jgi:hypothetical protein